MTTHLDKSRDPRDVPNYSLDEAARWLGRSRSTLRTWLVGQNYRAGGINKLAPPVIQPASRDPLSLSLWNLVECSVLATIREGHKVSLQRVRRALTYVAKQLGRKRPLIEQEFSTDGVSLFVERYNALIDVTSEGQLAINDVLRAGLTRIECDADGLAARLFPWRTDPREPRIIAVDPKVAFGQPVLAHTRVPVDVILDRYRAGDTMQHLADDYRVARDTIEDLLRKWFESAAA